MKPLHRDAALAIVRMLILLGAAIFLPVWSVNYWQGWACLASFVVPATIITIWIARNDPALLERRLKGGPRGESKAGQKVVQTFAALAFVSEFLVGAFDHRYGWSRVPPWASVAGDLMMLIGFWVTAVVFRENTYTSGIIEVAEHQQVICTGPYAVVRHPMYAGALIMLFGIPLALGSWWGMLASVLLLVAIVWRLLDEEQFLKRELPGYGEYCTKTKDRLIPYVW